MAIKNVVQSALRFATHWIRWSAGLASSSRIRAVEFKPAGRRATFGQSIAEKQEHALNVGNSFRSKCRRDREPANRWLLWLIAWIHSVIFMDLHGSSITACQQADGAHWPDINDVIITHWVASVRGCVGVQRMLRTMQIGWSSGML